MGVPGNPPVEPSLYERDFYEWSLQMADLLRLEDDAGIRASQAEIEKLLAREKQRGVAAHRATPLPRRS